MDKIEKKLLHKHVGPGGLKCPCCAPAPGSHARKKIVRNALRAAKKMAIKEGTLEFLEEQPQDDDLDMEEDSSCPCGRGKIERDPKTGVSLHKVFLDSYSFGRAEYGDCCKQCEDEQRAEADDESDWRF